MKNEWQEELEKRLFQTARIVLGKDCGGMVAKLKNARGVTGAWNAIIAAAGTADPREYIGAALVGIRQEKPTLSQEEQARLMEKYYERRRREGWL